MGEALQVKLSNVDWKAKPVTVWLDESITKTGEGRHVFLTSEAAEFIRKVWLTPTDDDGVVLSNRERFMRAAMNKGKGLGITRPRIEIDDRVWPFESPTAHKFISTAIRRAGYNAKTKTGLSQLHPHSTRKFFRTIFGRAAGPDAAEEIMGHAGYLTGSYRKTERDELAAIFLKHESALHINLTPEARHAMETRDLHAAAIVQLQQQNKRLVKDMEIMKRIINRGSEVEKS
jgi:integrase